MFDISFGINGSRGEEKLFERFKDEIEPFVRGEISNFTETIAYEELSDLFVKVVSEKHE